MKTNNLLTLILYDLQKILSPKYIFIILMEIIISLQTAFYYLYFLNDELSLSTYGVFLDDTLFLSKFAILIFIILIFGNEISKGETTTLLMQPIGRKGFFISKTISINLILTFFGAFIPTFIFCVAAILKNYIIELYPLFLMFAFFILYNTIIFFITSFFILLTKDNISTLISLIVIILGLEEIISMLKIFIQGELMNIFQFVSHFEDLGIYFFTLKALKKGTSMPTMFNYMNYWLLFWIPFAIVLFILSYYIFIRKDLII